MTRSLIAFRGILCVSLSLSTLASTALAQVPTSVDPAQIERRFEPETRTLPSAAAPKVPEIPRPSQAAPAKPIKQFELRSVNVEGNTVFSGEQLKPLYQEYIGKTISTADAQAIAAKVTDYYRSREYILTQAVIPSQNVDTGELNIRVIEGYIANVIIQGDLREGSLSSVLQGYGEQIKAEKPLKLSKLERYLLLMDDLPGVTARGVVRPSSDTFGAADLVVTLEHKLFEFSLSGDNRGTEFVGPFQWTGTAAANSLFNMYERTLLRTVTTSPFHELQFYDLQHEQQVGKEGTRATVNVSYSQTEPGESLSQLDVEGRSFFASGRVAHPFIRSRTENLQGRAIFDYRNTTTDFLDQRFSQDRIRSIRVGGTYDIADKLDGVNLIDAVASQGLDILNASENDSDRSRANGDSSYTKFNLDISRTQYLPLGFSILTAATAQYALDPLLPAEQFILGGPNFGQAYDPSEVSGDHGVGAKIEARYGNLLNDPYMQSYQFFAYYDIGTAWIKDAGAGVDDRASLASIGTGVRVNFVPGLSGSLEVGYPLTKRPNGSIDEDPRIFFSMTSRF